MERPYNVAFVFLQYRSHQQAEYTAVACWLQPYSSVYTALVSDHSQQAAMT
jgi:hypothetical protein